MFLLNQPVILNLPEQDRLGNYNGRKFTITGYRDGLFTVELQSGAAHLVICGVKPTELKKVEK